VPLRAVANAILSAGNTTDLANLHQPSVSGIIPTQAGAPVFPNLLPARILTTTLVDFTTMDRNLQNAYSRQASIEAERVLARGMTASVGYQYLRGPGHQQRLPSRRCVSEQQPVLVGGGLDVSRAAPVARAAPNYVGERARHLHTLEIDEQRWRGVLQLASRSH
jgi:hypothetical protein